uniref:Ymf63-like protein n=1 Tax=Paramecium gigas TaxID=2709424 RepID=UPI001D0346A5|nr:Ymf63-like protein [Paramecium gigas]QVG61512.1 Ymf63-like protein [Paramecium gigas]
MLLYTPNLDLSVNTKTLSNSIDVYLKNKNNINFENFDKIFLKQKTQTFFKTNLHKRNSELFFKKNAFEKFQSFFLKNGLKKKSFRALSFSMYILFSYFNENNEFLQKKYSKSRVFLNIYFNDINLNNYNNFFFYFFEYLTYSFFF